MAEEEDYILKPQSSIAVILTNSIYDGDEKQINEGQFADLRQPARDKELIREFAAQVGFPIRSEYIIFNGNQDSYQKMGKKLKNEVMDLSENDKVVVFVYYSGHGVQQEKATHAVVKHDNMIKLYNIDNLVFSLACLPNVFIFSLFDCCREIRKSQKDETTNGQAIGREISGHLFQIYSTVGGDVTAINKNDEHSEVTKSFVQQCVNQLGKEKKYLPIQKVLKSWNLKIKCPIKDQARVDLLLKYDKNIKPEQSQNGLIKQETKVKKNTEEVEYLCPNGHQLLLVTDVSQRVKKCWPGQNARTECCGMVIGSTKNEYYHCEKCCFELCPKCIKTEIFKHLAISRTCPNAHFMYEFYTGEVPPYYAKYYGNSVNCDICKKTNIQKGWCYYNCQLCLYDRCVDCQQDHRKKLFQKLSTSNNSNTNQGQQNNSQKQTCFNGHLLQFFSYESQQTLYLNSNCDLCRFKIVANKQSQYRCSQCDFDKCMECYKKGITQILPAALCPKKHRLQFYEPGHWFTERHICDICGINIWQKQLGIYNCASCNFDRCSNCFNSNKLK